MIARRFTSVVWVAAIGAAALTCYTFSAQVAEERAGLQELEAQILRTERSIRTLKTELGTRGRVHQLQHWASTDFGFAAPGPGQFLDNEVTLASLDAPVEAPAMDAPVRMAEATAPAARLPRAVQASAPVAAPARPEVRRASAPSRAAEPMLRRAVAAPTQASVATRPATAPRRTASPVSEATLRDLDQSARAERVGARAAPRPR